MDPRTKSILIRNAPQIFHDEEIFQALLKAARMDSDDKKIVDLRAALIEQLNRKLNIADEMHRETYINAKAFYDTQISMNVVILELMKARSLNDFLSIGKASIESQFDIDHVCVITGRPEVSKIQRVHPCLIFVPISEAQNYFSGNSSPTDTRIILRKAHDHDLTRAISSEGVQGSEAILKLDLGDTDILAGLVLLSKNPTWFTPGQATDFLSFLTSYYELHLQKWLED